MVRMSLSIYLLPAISLHGKSALARKAGIHQRFSFFVCARPAPGSRAIKRRLSGFSVKRTHRHEFSLVSLTAEHDDVRAGARDRNYTRRSLGDLKRIGVARVGPEALIS